MKYRKIIAKLLVAALATTMLTSMTGCSKKKENKKGDMVDITICLDWTPNTNHTGLYVAKEMGYYEKAGLNVTIVQPPENGAVLMCSVGQAQFAIDAQDTFAAALDSGEKYDVEAVAAIIQHNTSGIISRKGEGLDKPAGLEGKTYSTWESPIELAMIKKVMEDAGVSYDSLTLIPNNITDEPAALAANQTDAIWVFYGWGGINADVEKVDCDYFAFGNVCPEFDYYTPVILGNKSFMKENPEAAQAFIDATKEGYEYAIKNPKEAADMLIKGDTTGSLRGREELVYSSQEWLSANYTEDGVSWGYIDKDRWNRFYTWLYENGLTANDLTGTGFNDSYISK